MFSKGQEEPVLPQPIKPNLHIDKSEAKVREEWDPMKRDGDVDKDTERWVEEQNAFFKRKKEKPKGEIPPKFDPKRPVRILQRKWYASTSMPDQVPQRLKDSRYTQPNY